MPRICVNTLNVSMLVMKAVRKYADSHHSFDAESLERLNKVLAHDGVELLCCIDHCCGRWRYDLVNADKTDV